MAGHRVRARPPRGEPREPAVLRGEAVGAYLQDAARTPGGHAPAVYLPTCEAEVAWVLRRSPSVLPVGAQSSLTGGATPFGQVVLSLARMTGSGPIRGDRVRVEAGAPLLGVEATLREHGLFYPPVPTFRSAFAGGVASTNAAGAATFKYGTTRAWVSALCVVLASGHVLEVERGECRADADGFFEIEASGSSPLRVPVPRYRPPDVPKRSAGYESGPGLDLVDLFVGSEGTL